MPIPTQRGVSCAFKRRSRPNAQTGLFIDDEEHALGLRCLAACIFDEPVNRLPQFLFPDRFHVLPMTRDRVWRDGD